MFWYTSGDTVPVDTGGFARTVGISDKGLPVTLGRVEETNRLADAVGGEIEEGPDVEDTRSVSVLGVPDWKGITEGRPVVVPFRGILRVL